MPKWWIATGSPEYWQIAFNVGKIWGVTDKKLRLWEKLANGDYILFYATKPVSGVIGYGVVRTKFKQYKPLWPREVKEGIVIWPYRFEFDVEYCLPQDKWATHKVSSKYISSVVSLSFQMVKEGEAQEIIRKLEPKDSDQRPVSTHDEIKNKIVQLGKFQGFIAESEYNIDGGRIDVVWRRVEKGSPTYVFEVQVGGDLYHAISKLKHAHDLWNSKIFLIITKDDVTKARELLSGTFHEIERKIRVIEIEKINELFKLKKAYKDLEEHLGIS